MAPGSAPTSPLPTQTVQTPAAGSAYLNVLSNARPADEAAAAVRTKIEKGLEETVQQLYEMEITAGYVVEGRGNFMESAVERLIRSYENLSELSSRMNETVPMGTLAMIDDGMNPHEYTKRTVNSALTGTQWANGKVQAFESYRILLMDMLPETFPDLADVLPPSTEKKPEVVADMMGFGGPLIDERRAAEGGLPAQDASARAGDTMGISVREEGAFGAAMPEDVEMRS